MLLFMPGKATPGGAALSVDALALASESIIDVSADEDALAAEAAAPGGTGGVLYPRRFGVV